MKVKINLTLDQEIKKKLIEIAEAKGVKPSQLISIWVSEEIEKNKK